MLYKIKGEWIRFLIALLIVPALALPLAADDAPPEEKKKNWRILLGAFAGQFDLQLQTKLPFGYTNPSTGQKELPSLGRVSGLTQNGSLDLGVEGIGPQKGFQFMAISDSLVFQATYARVDVNFAPMRTPPIGVNVMEGNAGGNVYSTNLDYYMNISRYVQPMVGVGYAAFGAYYKVRNVVGTTVGNGLYESFPTIDADDGYSSDVGKAGLRIKLPIQSWYVLPYFQYAGNEYHINVRTTAGTVQNSRNGFPTNPDALGDAWYYQGIGSVTNVDSMTQVSRQARSAGMVFFMDYKKFISLTINARRNFSQAAWNISATLVCFFHPNMGIMASYSYAEPEILLSFNRAWAIGPVFTASF